MGKAKEVMDFIGESDEVSILKKKGYKRSDNQGPYEVWVNGNKYVAIDPDSSEYKADEFTPRQIRKGDTGINTQAPWYDLSKLKSDSSI